MEPIHWLAFIQLCILISLVTFCIAFVKSIDAGKKAR